MIRRSAVALVIAATLVTLAGCSQVAALAPVGGDGLAEVRFGAVDVLLDHGIDIGVAPVCTAAATSDAVTCAGGTTDGTPILVESSTAADATLSVTVGTEQIFTGALTSVLDDAARG